MSWKEEVKKAEKKAEKLEEKGHKKQAEKIHEAVDDIKKEHINYGLLFSAFIFLIGIIMVVWGYYSNKDLFTVGAVLVVLSIIIAAFSGKQAEKKD